MICNLKLVKFAKKLIIGILNIPYERDRKRRQDAFDMFMSSMRRRR